MRRRGAALALLASIVPGAASARDSLNAVVGRYAALDAAGQGSGERGWPDPAAATAAARTHALAALRRRLAALPPATAGSEAALTRRLLDWRLGTELEAARFDEARIPFDNGDGFFNTANYAAQTTVLHDAADARAWIARLKALPGYYAAQIVNMRRGVATGFTAPRPTALSVLAVLQTAAAQPAMASPLLTPFDSLPGTMPVAERAELKAEGLAVVTQAIKPAQAALVAFFARDYLPHARPDLAAASLPDGRAYYAFAARRATTLPLGPDAIFATGEREIARIRGEMEAAKTAAGYDGPLADFIAMLRRDPRFYALDLPDYVRRASEIGKRIDGMLPRWFGRLPRLPWTIRIKPPELDASSSGYDLGDPARGVAGSVVVGQRSFGDPLFGLPAWMLHEGVPGHHLQIALGQERTDLPAFRRQDAPTAFVEGWALYAEGLGEEMGVYRDPYERFGRLSFAMWRACRLVMDVGLHWKGWSAERAAACLRDNTALPERVVLSETQRYIAWPGQALAYTIGAIAFRDERARAERALGPRFDIRAFHDAVLDDGPMPLAVLHDQVSRFISRTGGRSPAAVR